jgi:carbamoyltransferase
MKHLVLAGGVALNCVANGRLLREGPFDDVWIQPAAGDAGGALGAALFTWHQLLDKPRAPGGVDAQKGSWLGPRFTTEQIRPLLDAKGAHFTLHSREADLLARVCDLIADGKVVGWFHGRMEFGPRALGSRSILGDARSAIMQSTMNLKIKFRESFRPFAPCVLRERVHEIFELREGQESPYMLLVAAVRPRYRRALSDEEQALARDPDLRRRVAVPRSEFPAITHVDHSARIQTVDDARHGRFYRLLRAFESRTGCPLMLNTSFNVRGEPIVHTPDEALQCFLHTHMDALVLEDCLLVRHEQPAALLDGDARRHLARFSPD